MTIERSSGVQLHITSLPSGRLGRDAYHFVNWLASAGQSWWQVLPLGPPDEARSPYKASSAFAASPALLGDPDAPVSEEERREFCRREGAWVEDWAAFAGGDRAVDDQVRFDREWSALRAYAAERGVRMIGDIPIYVAPGSADHVAHPELFREGVVAGAPPDYFSELGQLWGNPIYDWPALQRRRYRWWVDRFRRVFDLFDVARFDHFRGVVAYWAVPADAPDARGGRWVRGPGRALFDAAAAELGELPIIAEDLGVITPPVQRLRDELGFPGMVVLQFAFDPSDPHGPHRPENHRENQVLYTGTHDNDTLRGWAESLPPERVAELRRAGVGEDEPWWDLIGIAMRSPARLAMVQVQDVLGLGNDARMNLPGTAEGNWGFRLEHGQLTEEHARRLRALTEEGGRA
ncbi:MAG: 4-alpha-glucanotransferase [Solirubrobacteraceae bacterium]|nr:4-alpha-glucanotransferase [Solirubrobacteraceae bacterium]